MMIDWLSIETILLTSIKWSRETVTASDVQKGLRPNMKNGVIDPIIVNKNEDILEVVSGRIRVKSAIEANKRLINAGKTPVTVSAVLN
jgi:ParB-like chromosome segregation protein Spo0J